MNSLLCICDQGYRASVEEQDDTVVWMAHMLQKQDDTSATLLLRGSAVNYANKAQRSVPVTFGEWTQKQPADFPRDLSRFVGDGGRVFALAEDLDSHGLSEGDLVEGVQILSGQGIAALVIEHDHVSFW